MLIPLNKQRKVEQRMKKYVQASQEDEVEKEEEEKRPLTALVQWLGKQLEGITFAKKWRDLLVHAGSTLTPSEFFAVRFLTALVMVVIAGLYNLHILFLIPIAFIGYMLPSIHMKRKIRKRLIRCSTQLSEALGTMANAMRAGFSFMQSMKLVSEEFPEPIGEEFAKTLRDIQLGVSVEEAFEKMLKRLPHKDLELTVKALLIQRTSGGNLSVLLETIQDTIRGRISVNDELNTLTSQGKMSSVIITLLPIALAGYLKLVNPEYFNVLFTHPIGWLMVIMACVNIVIGWIFIRKIVQIEV